MRARPRLLAEIFAAGCALALASVSLPAGALKLPVSFEVYPGVAYLALLAWPALLGGGGPAEDAPDVQLAAYGGPSYTMASKLRLVQPGGTDLSFDAIPWDGQPFKPPPYYGLRGILWPAGAPQGIMVDFTHIKAKARKGVDVGQTGTRDGLEVPSREPLSATLSKLEFTHGYNLLTLNLVRRSALSSERLIGYAGAGAGIAIPHVEVGRAGRPPSTRTSEYQLTGPVVQVLGGIEWRVGLRFSVFAEYKLSCSAIRGAVKGGGSVETNLCTHQLLAGPAVHLQARTMVAKP